MFIDTAEIHVKAGNGGDGAVSFRREKFVPKGGPDGGDGGHGGSVIFIADPNINTLVDFSGKHHWRAENGQAGSGKKMHGKSGKDLLVSVPPGTEVYDLELGLHSTHDAGGLKIADLVEPGQEVVIAKGGKGGAGNWHFRTSTNQTPREHTVGEAGQERRLHMELKLIADVGLAGLPNAGKSTFLSAVSHARPKVADYPFTTLEPNLGIAELDNERRIVVADIPGLIHGASGGAGLGHAFLKHIERCKVLLHLVDLVPFDGSDPIENYHTIRRELETFSPALAQKPQIIGANKIDLLTEGDGPLRQLREALPGENVIPLSGATRSNLPAVLEALWKSLYGKGLQVSSNSRR